MELALAIVTLATEIAKIVRLNIEAQPIEQRAAFAKQQWEDYNNLLNLAKKFIPNLPEIKVG